MLLRAYNGFNFAPHNLGAIPRDEVQDLVVHFDGEQPVTVIVIHIKLVA